MEQVREHEHQNTKLKGEIDKARAFWVQEKIIMEKIDEKMHENGKRREMINTEE